jgi:hypothetical protein
MSWSDIFPILTDEMLDSYLNTASDADKRMLDEIFEISRVENPRSGINLVATSLFWPTDQDTDIDFSAQHFENPRQEHQSEKISLDQLRDKYIEPLLDGASILLDEEPDVVIRVYLSADLDFLIEELIEVGCEVALMKGSSPHRNPGAMWRFLALEEADRRVTVVDMGRDPEILHNLFRTEHAISSGQSYWRTPCIDDRDLNNPQSYRPISSSQFGGTGGEPVGLLMRATIWHALQGTLPQNCPIGSREGVEHRREFSFLSYRFDDWFLMAALYPRIAGAGLLTLIDWNSHAANHWLVIDIEYTTWANPQSEVVYSSPPSFANEKKKTKETIIPQSAILETKIAVKQSEQASRLPLTKVGKHEPLTLVVARYKEDTRWILELPAEVTVALYNKGPEIEDGNILERVDYLANLPNVGREADTYLYHISNFPHQGPNEWTVFCQGDPFPHNPHFLDLLELSAHWSDVQPLTAGYLEKLNIPPTNLRITLDMDWLGDIPVHTELCSASTMDMNGWQDEVGRNIFSDYVKHNKIPSGWSISGHFLECCGLKDLAEKAWEADLLRFCYGATFALRNERLALVPQDCIPAMRTLAQGHYANGYVYEKLWLHIFGIPFVSTPKSPISDYTFQ